jgi:hypothetical protein
MYAGQVGADYEGFFEFYAKQEMLPRLREGCPRSGRPAGAAMRWPPPLTSGQDAGLG